MSTTDGTGDEAVIGRRGLQPKGVARRQEILDRAIEVFRERGADGTSLRRIAEAIGVSHAALLHYFDSREQLLVAVYAHAEIRRNAGADPIVTPGVDTMIAAAIANVDVPGLVQLYTTLLAASLEAGNDVGREFFSARFERVRDELTSSFRRQQADGDIRDDVPAEELAALLIAASDGLQIQWLLEPSIGLSETLRTFGRLLQPPR
ncbi:TetR/AcrR family transcriptional regulator [Microbacterium laevaniformans]|uniref:TetR/AcrR family transcriptional regulator n=1 Tax=Microbacterium laevaniformans TaxID=36807 RepID=UPI00195E3281|nr:TetR/AcrR family transcriptional regulator [Microbacterium laevaniformans]MBM7753547.1 AcrR family transcriptional regulator [Microbacterium laevaniformans]